MPEKMCKATKNKGARAISFMGDEQYSSEYLQHDGGFDGKVRGKVVC